MTKKRTPMPMETQPLRRWRHDPIPMAPFSSKKQNPLAHSRPTIPQGKAETSRQSSLKKQRSQLAATKLKRRAKKTFANHAI
jgi:hypothetical protein